MLAERLEEARARLRPHAERAKGFSGWVDFPEAKPIDPDKPWDYMQRARELIRHATSVLDIGTGGGERLAQICEGFPGRVVATEEWPVNAPVAAALLQPRGIGVVLSADEHLPFADGSFDLVLDRHSALDPAHVPQVLRPGGTVLTQQCGHDNWRELFDYFPRHTDFGDHFTRYRRVFEASGLKIQRAERHERRVAYSDLGPFVYMLCVVPWEVPDFDPLGADLQALLEMERGVSTDEGFVVTEVRYIIEAQRPS